MSHGGSRARAGRPPRGGERGRKITVRLAPELEAELRHALRDGETLCDLLREGAALLARSRVIS